MYTLTGLDRALDRRAQAFVGGKPSEGRRPAPADHGEQEEQQDERQQDGQPDPVEGHGGGSSCKRSMKSVKR